MQKRTEACGNPWNLVLVGPSTVTTHTADAEPTVATSETLETMRGLGRDDALDLRNETTNESKRYETNETYETNELRTNETNDETIETNARRRLRPRKSRVRNHVLHG